MAAAPVVDLLQALAALAPDNACADAACAKAVREFRGDINSVWVCGGQVQLLAYVVSKPAPSTLAALAARGDVDPDVKNALGYTPLFSACRHGTLTQFLSAFPAANVHAECEYGATALGIATTPIAVQTLLDYGAVTPEPLPIYQSILFGEYMPVVVAEGSSRRITPNWAHRRELYTVVERYVVLRRLRTAWTAACMAVSKDAAVVVQKWEWRSHVLACQLSDGLRVCIPVDDYLLASEYAGLIALFL